jgi:hypothetical protein
MIDFTPYTRDEVKRINAEHEDANLNEVEANVFKAMSEMATALGESIVTAQMVIEVTGFTEGQVRRSLAILQRKGWIG